MKGYNQYKRTTTKDRKGKAVHRIIAEKATGCVLPLSVEVHHLDGDKANNDNTNLVVCQDRKYHQLLHRRQEILEGGFDPWTHHKCTDCSSFLPIEQFSKNRTRASGYNNCCKACESIRQKQRYREKLKLSV